MENIEAIPIESFKRGFVSMSKELDRMKANDETNDDEKEMIDWFYELLDEHFSTSDLCPFD